MDDSDAGPCHPTVLDFALHQWKAVTRDVLCARAGAQLPLGRGKHPRPGRSGGTQADTHSHGTGMWQCGAFGRNQSQPVPHWVKGCSLATDVFPTPIRALQCIPWVPAGALPACKAQLGQGVMALGWGQGWGGVHPAAATAHLDQTATYGALVAAWGPAAATRAHVPRLVVTCVTCGGDTGPSVPVQPPRSCRRRRWCW